MSPKRYRFTGSAEVYLGAIERVLQPGEEFETDVSLTNGALEEINEAPQPAAKERNAAEPQVSTDA